MKRIVSFFEIPAADFNRAVHFYESVFGIKFSTYECDTEKMAFFPDEEGKAPGAISYSQGFNPSKDGVLISLEIEDMNSSLATIEKNNGTIIQKKTKIEAEGRGYFALFNDSEGNRIGLYSEN